MNAIVCDKCRTKITGDEIADNKNRIKLEIRCYDGRGFRYNGVRTFDLCEKCYADFLNWLAREEESV